MISAADEMTGNGPHFFPVWPVTLAAVFAFLDVPLSAVGDTIFLPWDAVNRVTGRRHTLIGSLSIQRPEPDQPEMPGMGGPPGGPAEPR